MAEPNTSNVRFLNSRQVYEDLQHLSNQLKDQIARKAVSKALAPISRQAKKNITPLKRSGLLRKSIVSKVKVFPSGVAFGVVGPDRGVTGVYEGRKVWPQKYFHMVEYGTRPHRIGKGSTLLQANKPNLKEVQQGYKHPGAKAFKPLARAAASSQSQAALAYAQAVRTELAKLNSKQ
jgi:hypothetical protein